MKRLAAESRAKDQYLNSVTGLLNEVGDRIDAIQQEQNDLVVLAAQPGIDGKRFVKSRDLPQALTRIDAHLKKNREQLSQLETLAASKSKESQGLRVFVERLKKQNGSLESQLRTIKRSVGALTKDVSRLKSEVGKLEVQVTEKEQEVKAKEDVILEQGEKLRESESERWAGFFVVGTRKDLRSQGLIKEAGGVLGLGRRPQLSENLSSFLGVFEHVDIREVEEIPLGKVRELGEVLPSRPSTSYAIEQRADGWYLLIRDPSEFWRLRYTVILVKR